MIAVVDDYEDLSIMLTRALELEGFEACRLPINANLLELSTWENIDKVVLDMSMPISGMAVLGFLKTHFPDIKVVVCSAMDSLSDQARADYPDVVLVSKPLRSSDLIKALHS